MNSKKLNIAILGSTGSIGKQALSVIKANTDIFSVEILTAGSNADLLIQQAKDFKPQAVVIADESKYNYISESLANEDIFVYAGKSALKDIVSFSNIDIILSGIVGIAGLEVAIETAKTGKRFAIANKEAIVVAGEILMQTAKQFNTEIIPVDSEHSAVFQCLTGEELNAVKTLYLTASGGPFLNKNIDTNNISIEDALKHPNWQMGKKISIDSATLMNKSFEIIEAHHLFNLKKEQIEVVIHPESVIHSLVKFIDGSVKAQMSVNDMRMQIKYAFTYPYRLNAETEDFDILKHNNLHFFEPDKSHKKALDLAYYAIEKSGNIPAIINAADEFLVDMFLHNKLKFNSILDEIIDITNKIDYIKNPQLDDIIATDKEVKIRLKEKYKKQI